MAIAYTDGSPAPARPKPLLVLIDGQEIARANEACGGRLRPAAIRDAIRQHGEIAFSFIVGSPMGITPRLEEDLIVAGFPIIPFAGIEETFLKRFAAPFAQLARLRPMQVVLHDDGRGAHLRRLDHAAYDEAPAVPHGRRKLLVVLDTENLARTLSGVGDELRPSVLWERIEEHGDITYAFAVGNVEVDAIPEDLWKGLMRRGFLPIHCPSLSTVSGGGMAVHETKSTVDGIITDLVYRVLRYATIDGIIVVSDDRDFAPAINAIRDRDLWFRRVSARRGGQLAAIGDTIHLALAGEPENSDDRSWAPDSILPHLGRLATLARRDRGPVFRRMELLRPVVVQSLRCLVLDIRGDEEALAMDALVARWHDTIRTAGIRVSVEAAELAAFAHDLVGAGILEEDGEGLLQLCEDHPFCQRVLNHERREDQRTESFAPQRGDHGTPIGAPPPAADVLRPARGRHLLPPGDG